jgi:hypothetical protein
MRVDENKDLGNEDTTKGNKFVWYLRRGKILYKENLAKCSWRENKKSVYSIITMRQLNTCFFQYKDTRSIWSVIQIASTWYHRVVLPTFWQLVGADNMFRIHIRWERLPLFGHLIWLCRCDKVFHDKIILSCRLSTGAHL